MPRGDDIRSFMPDELLLLIAGLFIIDPEQRYTFIRADHDTNGALTSLILFDKTTEEKVYISTVLLPLNLSYGYTSSQAEESLNEGCDVLYFFFDHPTTIEAVTTSLIESIVLHKTTSEMEYLQFTPADKGLNDHKAIKTNLESALEAASNYESQPRLTVTKVLTPPECNPTDELLKFLENRFNDV